MVNRQLPLYKPYCVKNRFVPKHQFRKVNQNGWLYATAEPINEQKEKA